MRNGARSSSSVYRSLVYRSLVYRSLVYRSLVYRSHSVSPYKLFF